MDVSDFFVDLNPQTKRVYPNPSHIDYYPKEPEHGCVSGFFYTFIIINTLRYVFFWEI